MRDQRVDGRRGRRGVFLAVVGVAVLGISSVAFALPAPIPGDATPDGEVAGWPEPIPAGCDVGADVVTGEAFTANGVTSPNLFALDVGPGDLVTMTWTGFKAGCEDVGVSFTAKRSIAPVFVADDNQELLPGWSYCGPAAGGTPCVATGGLYTLTVRVPAAAVACNWQIDATIGRPLEIVGPNGSYYKWIKPWNRLISYLNGGTEEGVCGGTPEPTELSLTITKELIGAVGTPSVAIDVFDPSGDLVREVVFPEPDDTPYTTTVTGLTESGTYLVREVDTGGAVATTPGIEQTVTLNPDTPTGAVTFTNDYRRPGPAASAEPACRAGTTVVAVTLSNTGTAPTTFDVAKGATVVADDVAVAAGATTTVPVTLAEGETAAIVVTSPDSDDTNLLAQPVFTDECEPPRVADASVALVCPTEPDAPSGLEVTLTAGDEETTFVVTAAGAEVDTVVVAAGEEDTVFVPAAEDTSVDLVVTASGDGFESTVFDDIVDVDCTRVQQLTVECADGGADLIVGNEDDDPVDLEVVADGQTIDTITVPANGETTVFIPVEGDEQVQIDVLEDGVVVGSTQTPTDCDATPTTPTTSPPTSVNPTTTVNDNLPQTGSEPFPTVAFGASLIAMGGLVLLAVRRRARLGFPG